MVNDEAMDGNVNKEGKVDLELGDEGEPEPDPDIRG